MIGIFSCNKDSVEETIEYPVTYESYSILESEINVYTTDGEIALIDIKNEFIIG